MLIMEDDLSFRQEAVCKMQGGQQIGIFVGNRLGVVYVFHELPEISSFEVVFGFALGHQDQDINDATGQKRCLRVFTRHRYRI